MKRRFVRRIELTGTLAADSYLHDVPAVRYLEAAGRLEFHSDVTFLVGENGVGKSTLLEAVAVACGFNPEGGSRNFSFSTRETHSELGAALTVVRSAYPQDGFFLRAESFYNAASYIDTLDEIPALSKALSSVYGGSLHEKSHGESFLALVQNRFRGHGLYLLDEPEAALSPMRPPDGSGLAVHHLDPFADSHGVSGRGGAGDHRGGDPPRAVPRDGAFHGHAQLSRKSRADAAHPAG